MLRGALHRRADCIQVLCGASENSMETGEITVRPLTLALWPALEDLFGEKGACGGCWCMYWRIGNAYRRRPGEENRKDIRKVVRRGPPPGLLAFQGKLPVGWCQLTPRSDLPWLDRAWAHFDEKPVWSISCFYVRIGYRRHGISNVLLEAAIRAARKARASALEAYPLDGDLSPSATSTGYLSSFARAGFVELGRRSPARPILRLSVE